MDGLIVILLVTYFIPTLVAGLRNHNNLNSILALNLLLGWTILGWIGAMVWSLANSSPSREVDKNSIDPEPSQDDREAPLPKIDETLIHQKQEAPTPQTALMKKPAKLSWVDEAKAELAKERK